MSGCLLPMLRWNVCWPESLAAWTKWLDPIIWRQGRLYTERLLSSAMESGFDLKAIPVVMLGGGAPVVKGNMSPQNGLCRVFALIDNRVNAEEFERILGQFSGGLSRG